MRYGNIWKTSMTSTNIFQGTKYNVMKSYMRKNNPSKHLAFAEDNLHPSENLSLIHI